MIPIVSEKNVQNNRIVTKEKLIELLEKDNLNIYEVIRVIDKKAIFLKEHFDRLNKSIQLSNLDFKLEYKDFDSMIKILIENNDFENCNIRVSVYLDENTKEVVTLMYFIKSSYPTKEMFENGVRTVTLKKHRNNPNVKLYDENLRDNVSKLMNKTNSFEVILINEDNTISEGSRSNIFFVQNETIITAKDSSVLLGVTREKVIKTALKNNIKLEKRSIDICELEKFDGAFITGTSNDVLPIKYIDNIEYNSSKNKIIKRLLELYIEEMSK